MGFLVSEDESKLDPGMKYSYGWYKYWFSCLITQSLLEHELTAY